MKDRYWYADEKQEIAEKLGFKDPKTAIIALYHKTRSARATGTPFGLTGEAIRKRLKQWGVPRYGPGGDQRSEKRRREFSAY